MPEQGYKYSLIKLQVLYQTYSQELLSATEYTFNRKGYKIISNGRCKRYFNTTVIIVTLGKTDFLIKV